MHSDCGLLKGVLLLLISNFALGFIHFCGCLCPSAQNKLLMAFNGLISTGEALLTWSNIPAAIPWFR